MEPSATILVADDEPEITLLMRDFLEAAGFAVLSANSGAAALAALSSGTVDCVLLDVMMPDMSGFEICREMRGFSETPVLFLTARDGDTDKIRGLSLGADDYIVKTATPAEVVARIRAVLRRLRRGQAVAAPPALLDYGRLVIDLRAHEVRVDGATVPLTLREFELLRLLAEHPRQVFTREHLFERIWGEFGDLHTVRVHIGRIREKIEPDPEHPQHIVTVWGIGYRFEGVPR